MSFIPAYTKAVITSYFGHDVGIIAEALTAGPKPIPLLYRKVADNLKNKAQFRKQLTVLYWHHIVDVETRNGNDWYSITLENVIRFAMLPSMLTVLEQIAGPDAAYMAKITIKEGRLSASDIVRMARAGAPKTSDTDFLKLFHSMTDDKVFMRTKRQVGETDDDPFQPPLQMLDGTSRIDKLLNVDAQMAELEETLLTQAQQFGQNVGANKLDLLRRQRRKELYDEADKVVATDSDAEILWRVNFNVLDRIYRDRLLLETLINDAGIDAVGEKIMRAVFGLCLKMQEGNASNVTMKYFSRKDVENLLKHHPEINTDDYDATFYLISSFADKFVSKVGDSSGGLYSIDYVEGLRKLLTKTLISMIEARYERPEEPEERRGLPSFVFSCLLNNGLVEEEKLATTFKHPETEIREELFRMREDGFVNVITKDASYEFNPMSSQFLYGVDLLKVNMAQFQRILQYQANYINRRLFEKEQVSSIKIAKVKARRMTDYAKQTITDPEDLDDYIEDVSSEFDVTKRLKLRRYRTFRDYLKKVEMMLNQTIWIMHRNREMEQRKRRDEGLNLAKRARKRAADAADGESEAKRMRY
uniref:DNA-directed RNA polymerase III subunit RPC3 n=1 Tax=Panagrellus redivivus TaxID=6233 RepID=A0A7E4URU3_PANRE